MNLANNQIKDTYGGVLNIGATGLTGSLEPVTDGFGNVLPFEVSSSTINFTGNVTGLTGALSGTSGTSGVSGSSGSSGTSGVNGSSGSSGVNGTSGTSGSSGVDGPIGPTGPPNGTSGSSGTSGLSGSSGTSGVNGTSGSSGSSGLDGSGTSGTSGISGSSGTSGISGSSGTSGISGSSGTSGANGTSGSSGTSGVDGSGTSGSSGTSGISGSSGSSGTSGVDGTSGSSGTSGVDGSGTSGTSGSSGSSGISGGGPISVVNTNTLLSDGIGATSCSNADYNIALGSCVTIQSNVCNSIAFNTRPGGMNLNNQRSFLVSVGDNPNLGNGSDNIVFATSNNTFVNGNNSVAIGQQNTNNGGDYNAMIGFGNSNQGGGRQLLLGMNNSTGSNDACFSAHVGFCNCFSSCKTFSLGFDNDICSPDSTVIGNTNSLYCGATGSHIFGANNVGPTGAQKIIVIGNDNNLNGNLADNTTIIGHNLIFQNNGTTTCGPSTVIGYNSCEITNNVGGGSVVIGTNSRISGFNAEGSVSIGYLTCVDNAYSVGIGFINSVPGSRAVAIGRQSTAYEDGVAMSWNASAQMGALSIGAFSNGGQFAVALGHSAGAGCEGSVALGRCSSATETNGVGIGFCARACHCNSYVLASCTTSERENTTHVNSLVAYGQGASKWNDAGSTGGTTTIDWNSANNQGITLTASTTLTLSNPIAGASYTIAVTQGGSGSYTITWPTILWSGGVSPSLSTAVGAIDLIALTYDGTNYYGSFANNFS